MDSRRVRFHVGARIDIDDAVRWYSAESEDLASDFEQEVIRAIGLIADSPNAWPEVAPRVRRFVLRRFPRAEVDLVEIVAVAHGSREPGYWRIRLADL